jgi:hypothetical protein
MLYTTKRHEGDDFAILTQNGGFATVHSNGECMVLTLFQNRMSDNPDEGKQYIKEFPYDTPKKEIIDHGLNWLSPQTKNFIYVK